MKHSPLLDYVCDQGAIVPARLLGCYISSGSQKSQSTSQPMINQQGLAMLNANVGRATGIADQPFQAYAGQMVAPANPTLTNSWNQYGDIAQNNTGAAPLNSAIDTAQGVAGYTPQTLSNTDLTPYMNPFTKDVTNTTLADMERGRQMARVSDAQKASAAGAFGGSRSGVAASLTNGEYDRNTASTLAGLNAANFNQAQGAAAGDIGRGLTGQQLNLSAASALSQMSDQELQQAMQRAGGVNQAGTQQQGIDQQTADALYQEFLRRQNYPIQGQTLINQSLGLVPATLGQNQQSTGSQSSFGFTLPLPGK